MASNSASDRERPPGGVISPEAVELWAKRGLDGVETLSLQLVYE